MFEDECRCTHIQCVNTASCFFGFRLYSPPYLDRIWGISGSYQNILNAIKGDHRNIILGGTPLAASLCAVALPGPQSREHDGANTGT